MGLCRQKNIPVGVISHKTRHAVCGPAHNLHDAGYQWLESAGFFDKDVMSRDQVFFEPSRAAKLNRIRVLGCSHFIDDLREVFSEPSFPMKIKSGYSIRILPKGIEGHRILFRPGSSLLGLSRKIFRMTPDDVASTVARATGEHPKEVVLLKGVGNNVVAKVNMAAGPRVAKPIFATLPTPGIGWEPNTTC